MHIEYNKITSIETSEKSFFFGMTIVHPYVILVHTSLFLMFFLTLLLFVSGIGKINHAHFLNSHVYTFFFWLFPPFNTMNFYVSGKTKHACDLPNTPLFNPCGWPHLGFKFLLNVMTPPITSITSLFLSLSFRVWVCERGWIIKPNCRL